MQQNNLLGQGGAVSGGGDKAEPLFRGFIRGIGFARFRGSFGGGRQRWFYRRYFGNLGESFIKGERARGLAICCTGNMIATGWRIIVR